MRRIHFAARAKILAPHRRLRASIPPSLDARALHPLTRSTGSSALRDTRRCPHGGSAARGIATERPRWSSFPARSQGPCACLDGSTHDETQLRLGVSPLD